MRFLLVLCVIAFLAMSLVSCKGGDVKSLYESAMLEEQQNNSEHARELYQEILNKAPDSDYAKRAKGRIDALKGR